MSLLALLILLSLSYPVPPFPEGLPTGYRIYMWGMGTVAAACVGVDIYFAFPGWPGMAAMAASPILGVLVAIVAYRIGRLIYDLKQWSEQR